MIKQGNRAYLNYRDTRTGAKRYYCYIRKAVKSWQPIKNEKSYIINTVENTVWKSTFMNQHFETT